MKNIDTYITEKLNVNKINLRNSIYWFTNNTGVVLPFTIQICGNTDVDVDIYKIHKYKIHKNDSMWSTYDIDGNLIFNFGMDGLRSLFMSPKKSYIANIYDKTIRHTTYRNVSLIKFIDDDSKIIYDENSLNEKLNINDIKINKYTYKAKSKEDLVKYLFKTIDYLDNKDFIDLSYIDVSNLDSLSYVFNKLSLVLPRKIDITGWNTKNITSLRSLFSDCKYLEEIKGLNTWDINDVTDMSFMFSWCSNLKYVDDLSNWNITEDMNTKGMFVGCKKLKTVGNIYHWRHNDILANVYCDSIIKPQPKKLP